LPTPSPQNTPQPDASATGNSAAARAASEAELKAAQAAKKAAEAAAVAAEASNAANEAAKAAAKAVAASKPRGHAVTTPGARKAASPGAQPSTSQLSRGQKGASPAGTPGSSEVTESTLALRHEAAKSIDDITAEISKYDRSKLASDDAQRYDMAAGLLRGAKRAMAKGDYVAASNLTNKAKIMLKTLPP